MLRFSTIQAIYLCTQPILESTMPNLPMFGLRLTCGFIHARKSRRSQPIPAHSYMERSSYIRHVRALHRASMTMYRSVQTSAAYDRQDGSQQGGYMCGHLYIFRAPSQTEKCSSATSCTSTQFSARGT
jgi:hypothetical protein